MIEYISKQLTGFIKKYESNDDNSEEILLFGSRILVTTLLNWLVVLGIGIITRQFFGSLIFLISYSVLRGIVGGHHAKSMQRCFGMSIGMFVVTAIMHPFFEKNMRELQIIVIILAIFVIKYAPLETRQNPMPQKIKRKRKLKSIITVICQIIVFSCLKEENIIYYGFFGVLWCEILFMIGVKEEKRYD